MPGLIMVLALYYAPYAFLLVHGALSLMNPDLEEAAFVHGGTRRRTLRRVTFPLALPAVLAPASSSSPSPWRTSPSPR